METGFHGWSSQCLQQTELSPAQRECAGRVVGRLYGSLGNEGTGFEGKGGARLNLWVSLLGTPRWTLSPDVSVVCERNEELRLCPVPAC